MDAELNSSPEEMAPEFREPPPGLREHILPLGLRSYGSGASRQNQFRRIRFIGTARASLPYRRQKSGISWRLYKQLYEIPHGREKRWIIHLTYIGPHQSGASEDTELQAEYRLCEVSLGDLLPGSRFEDLGHFAGLGPDALELDEALDWDGVWLGPLPPLDLDDLIGTPTNGLDDRR